MGCAPAVQGRSGRRAGPAEAPTLAVMFRADQSPPPGQYRSASIRFNRGFRLNGTARPLRRAPADRRPFMHSGTPRVLPGGLEPPPPAPEAGVLSPRPWELAPGWDG